MDDGKGSWQDGYDEGYHEGYEAGRGSACDQAAEDGYEEGAVDTRERMVGKLEAVARVMWLWAKRDHSLWTPVQATEWVQFGFRPEDVDNPRKVIAECHARLVEAMKE